MENTKQAKAVEATKPAVEKQISITESTLRILASDQELTAILARVVEQSEGGMTGKMALGIARGIKAQIKLDV